MTDKPLLILMLGVPGSGKSYFSRNLAERIDAVRLNSDSMRQAIFGSVEEVDKIYHSGDRKQLNAYVFNALDYAVGQLLEHGDSVVYDANHNQRSTRDLLEKLAEKHGGLSILVFIRTPYEVALKRGQERDASHDQRQLSEDKMREVIDRYMAEIDLPIAPEKVIEISGELPFDEQFIVFQEQLEMIRHE